MSAGARFLIDTNVLVYADDVNEVVKRDRARAVIAAIGSNRSGLVTTQVLGEYLVTVARRFAETLSPSEGIERLEFFAEILTTQSVSLPVVREAARGVERYGMAYLGLRAAGRDRHGAHRGPARSARDRGRQVPGPVRGGIRARTVGARRVSLRPPVPRHCYSRDGRRLVGESAA
jgi:predicted nucleic acid-binding protein